MNTRSFGVTILGLIAVVGAALLAFGLPGGRAPTQPSPANGPKGASVSVDGFTLTSDTVELPTDDPLFPDGPNVEVVNSNCASCHSASMALTQPLLPAEKWKEIVVKMRDVYKAPIAETDIAPIVAYFTAHQKAEFSAKASPAP